MEINEFRTEKDKIQMNYNSLHKQKKIPKPGSNIIPNKINDQRKGYHYYLSNLKKINQNKKLGIKLFSPEINKNSYNISSYENINPNNNQDINIMKMKIGFNLLNQKINMINDKIQLLSDSNKKMNVNINKKLRKKESIHFNDDISKNNFSINNYHSNTDKFNINLIKNRASQSQKDILPYYSPYNDNNIDKYYSIQNTKYQNNINNNNVINNNNFTNSNSNKNIYYSKYNSLENENIMNVLDKKPLKLVKYNSYKNLRLNNYFNNFKNINNINRTKDNSYNNNYNNFINSIKKINIEMSQPKEIKKRNTHTYFDFNAIQNYDINKITNSNSYRLNGFQKTSSNLNNKYNNFIKIYNNIKNNKVININKNDIKYDDFIKETNYGSFDDYFLDNKSNKIKNNDKIDNINDYMDNNEKIDIDNNINLIIENQKCVFYFGNKDIKNNMIITEESLTLEEDNTKRIKYQQDQLQKCCVCDLFLPQKEKKILKYLNEKEIFSSNNINKNINEINICKSNKNDIIINNKTNEINSYIIINQNNSNEDGIKNKFDNINNNISKNYDINEKNKIIKNKRNIKCYDDFYYDLYAEKIIDIEKSNNSIDENYKLSEIKERIFKEIEKTKCIKNSNKKEKIKKVRFFEGDNHYIQFNTEEKATKFIVLNYLGNKIYFKHFDINKYFELLKNKNNKIKSIIINKKIDTTDNSEWDNIFDVLNKIKNKSKNSSPHIKNKNGFRIKNIESFKKNGIMIKKNKSSNSIKKSRLKNKENLNNINKINKDSKNESLNNKLKNMMNDSIKKNDSYNSDKINRKQLKIKSKKKNLD